jgi:hypothetical protein
MVKVTVSSDRNAVQIVTLPERLKLSMSDGHEIIIQPSSKFRADIGETTSELKRTCQVCGSGRIIYANCFLEDGQLVYDKISFELDDLLGTPARLDNPYSAMGFVLGPLLILAGLSCAPRSRL